LRRIEAWSLREDLREHPRAPARLRHCGVYRYATTVQLLTSGEGRWWHGVIQCRARVCPPCFVARRFRNAAEIEHVVTEREAETQKQSFLATFTVRHHAHDPVSLTKGVRAAWRRMLQSRRWQTFREDFGLEWIVAEEVTRGENGWHPHLHALLMPRKRIDPDDVWSQAYDFHAWWSRAVTKQLGKEHAPSREHGCDLRACDSAAYLTKLGLELSDPSMVKGRSPLDLLDHGEIERYLDLQLSRTRARDITWSRGLKGIRDAMPEPAPPAELAAITGTEWGRIRHQGFAVPLEIAEHATDPEAANEAIARALAGESPARDPGKGVSRKPPLASEGD
jgi:hypothetical protein